jgi:hypothetical protein
MKRPDAVPSASNDSAQKAGVSCLQLCLDHAGKPQERKGYRRTMGGVSFLTVVLL